MYVIKCATQLGAFAMKTITTQQITEAVRQLCMDVSYDLPQDVETALEQGLAKEESSFGKYCLEQIIQNISSISKMNTSIIHLQHIYF